MEHLLPADPLTNKLSKKCKNAHVSRVTSPKKVVPKREVELRFYKYKEFAALSDAQKEELRELRPKGKGSNGKSKFVWKGQRKVWCPISRSITIGQRIKLKERLPPLSRNS